MVIKESCIDLPLEIFAGRFVDGKFLGVAMAPEGFVALTQPKWHPAHFVLDGNDLQCGITLENSRKDHVEQSIFDLSGLIHAVTITDYALGRTAIHAGAEPSKDMQVNRHVQVLRRRPEALVML